MQIEPVGLAGELGDLHGLAHGRQPLRVVDGAVADQVEAADHHEDRREVHRAQVGAVRPERVRRRVVPGGAGRQRQPPEPVHQVKVRERLLRALGLRRRAPDAAEERHQQNVAADRHMAWLRLRLRRCQRARRGGARSCRPPSRR